MIRLRGVADLKACGVARVSLPTIAIFSAIRALGRTLGAVRDSGDFSAILKKSDLCSPEELAAITFRGA